MSSQAASASGEDTNISYLRQRAAQELDEDLMGSLGFSLDQLMELAGLSVASAIADAYPLSTHSRVVVLAGPGNNGGDGLVAARHLTHFGYRVSICYPKRTERPIYHGLVTQCQSLGIEFLEAEQVLAQPLAAAGYDIIVDALFGFSFKGTPRSPFDSLIAAISPPAEPPSVVSVDIPSGWDVEQGDVDGSGLRPNMLISLTAPKYCAKLFTGQYHYLGGRFVPPEIVSKYSLKLPAYPGTSQCVRLGPSAGAGAGAVGASAAAGAAGETPRSKRVADMRQHYGAAGHELDEAVVSPDPWVQFSGWFDDARNSKVKEPNAMAIATSSLDGAPSLRMVLLKGFDNRGLSFFTNYSSRKGKELTENPSAAVTFFWDILERQVRFEGHVEKLQEEESDAYWKSRPRGSQIGALASRQSEVVISGGRKELEKREEEVEKAYPEGGGPIPRPEGWGGFLVKPTIIEFWQGRPSRLHDRLRYSKQEDGTWKIERLCP